MSRFALPILLLLICNQRISAQYAPDYTWGTSFTTPSAIPYWSPANGVCKAQWLFYPSQFGAPSGIIDTIYIKVDAPFVVSFDSVTFKMGTTMENFFVPLSPFVTGLTTVFDAPASFGVSNGWMIVILSTPYYYHNEENLVVETYHGGLISGTQILGGGGGGVYRTLYGYQSDSLGTTDLHLVGFGFDLRPFPVDLSPTRLLAPAASPACYSASQPLEVRIKNLGVDTLDMSLDSLTVSTQVTGPNPQNFSFVQSSGIIPPGDSINLLLASSYDMSQPGSYQFTVITSCFADSLAVNDTLVITRLVSANAGIASSIDDTVCSGSSIQLFLTDTAGQVQWEWYNGGNWSPLPGVTGNQAMVSPTVTTQYRAVVCGGLYSNVLQIEALAPNTQLLTTGNTRCGFGPLTLNAQGAGSIFWFDSLAGNQVIDTGHYYTPYLGSSDTFYVESHVLNATGTGGEPNNLTSSGIVTVGAGMTFTVFNTFWLDSVALYPLGSDSVLSCVMAIVSSGGDTVYKSAPYTQPGMGLKAWMPVGVLLSPGDYKMILAESIGYADYFCVPPASNVPFPYYATTGSFRITDGTTPWGNSPAYYYFYDWRHHSVCVSPRVPVPATVTPAPPVSITTSDTSICAGDTIALSASGLSAYSYKWRPGQNLSDSTQASIQGWMQDTVDLVLYGLDPFGCAAYDTLTINVTNLGPSLALSSPDPVCGGTALQLSASGSGNQYSWQASHGSQPAAIPNPLVYPPGDTIPVLYYYTLTRHDTLSGCSQDTTLLVTVNPGAFPNLGADSSVCAFTDVVLDAGPGYLSYQWNNGDTSQQRSISQIQFNNQVLVTVTNVYGCTGSDGLMLTVLPRPVVNLGPDTSICVNHTIVFNTGSYASYLWSNGDTTKTSMIGPNATSGYIWIEVNNQHGCSHRDSLYLTIEPCTGLDEQATNGIRVYPNPNEGVIYVDFPPSANGSTELEVINGAGQVVYRKLVQGSSNCSIILDEAPGLYLLRLRQDDTYATVKLILR